MRDDRRRSAFVLRLGRALTERIMDKEDFKKIIKNVEYFLLDMDGTVYVGDRLIGEMSATLDRLRAVGKKLIYLTNNSSKSRARYIEKLKKTGLFRDGDDVYTSGMATAEYLKEFYGGASVYLLGTNALKAEFAESGINLTDETADVSVLAYDTELEYGKLCRFTYNVTKGSKYIATHPDVNCPAPDVFLPDAGAIMALVERSTGKTPDIVVGKPFPTMGENLKRKFACGGNRFIMVGDRLHTDIKFGNNCGFHTLFVLSGEGTRSDLARFDAVPSFTLDSLNDIIEYI